MKHLLLTSIIAAALAAPGCVPYSAPVMPPRGLVSYYKAPLTTDFDATDTGSKVGRVSTSYVRIPTPWVDLDFAWSQADVEAAARNGGITTVTYVDYEYLSILGFVGKFTLIAHGN